MNEQERAIWQQGKEYGRHVVGVELMKKYAGDKLAFVEDLYQAACREKTRCMTNNHDERASQWAAYAEGLRHVLNILKTMGAPKECYKTLIKNTMPIDVDNMPPAYKGH